MALVDLKSKLNEFGRNNPDNPYQKGDKRGDLENSTKPDIDKDKYLEIGENPESDLTELDSKYDRENTPKSAIVREETSKTRLKQNVEDFGLSPFDVPTSDNYEDNIKKENIDGFSDVTRVVKQGEKLIKGVKDILKGNISRGIRTTTEASQDAKLEKYRASAYGRIKTLGEQGKKVSRVDSRVSSRYDGPVKGGLNSRNVNQANITEVGEKGKDTNLIRFRFKDIFNNEFINFSAILSGITDTITPEYHSDRFIGRPDQVHTYVGADRSIGFTFDVYPTTRQEMKPLWSKINRLVGLCYPNFVPAYNSRATTSPLTELSIGDLYHNTPGFLSSVTTTVMDNSTWDYEKGMELPHYVQIACEFTYIGKYEHEATGKHFELDWVEEPTITDLRDLSIEDRKARREKFREDKKNMSRRDARGLRRARRRGDNRTRTDRWKSSQGQ